MNSFHLLLNDIRNLVEGNIVSAAADPVIQVAADRYIHLKRISYTGLAITTVSLGLLALVLCDPGSCQHCAHAIRWNELFAIYSSFVP